MWFRSSVAPAHKAFSSLYLCRSGRVNFCFVSGCNSFVGLRQSCSLCLRNWGSLIRVRNPFPICPSRSHRFRAFGPKEAFRRFRPGAITQLPFRLCASSTGPLLVQGRPRATFESPRGPFWFPFSRALVAERKLRGTPAASPASADLQHARLHVCAASVNARQTPRLQAEMMQFEKAFAHISSCSGDALKIDISPLFLLLFQGRHVKTGQLAAIKVMDVTGVRGAFTHTHTHCTSQGIEPLLTMSSNYEPVPSQGHMRVMRRTGSEDRPVTVAILAGGQLREVRMNRHKDK